MLSNGLPNTHKTQNDSYRNSYILDHENEPEVGSVCPSKRDTMPPV